VGEIRAQLDLDVELVGPLPQFRDQHWAENLLRSIQVKPSPHDAIGKLLQRVSGFTKLTVASTPSVSPMLRFCGIHPGKKPLYCTQLSRQMSQRYGELTGTVWL
jgi:hypothetical protein